jgi:hypothetical protein
MNDPAITPAAVIGLHHLRLLVSDVMLSCDSSAHVPTSCALNELMFVLSVRHR